MPKLLSDARRFARSDFARHGFVVFVAMSLVNAFGYAFHFAISRRIGVEQYGVLSALNSVLMISTVFATIVATIVVKYAAEFRATGDHARLAVLVRRLALYGSLAAAVAIAVGAAAAVPLAAYLKIASVPAVLLTMVVIGIGIATPALRAVFQGVEDFTSFALSICVESSLKLVLGVGFVYAGFGVVGAFVGWAAGSFVALVYTVVVLVRRYRRVPGAPLFIDMARLRRTMAGVAVATTLVTSISNVDVLLVKHFADPTTAGLYGALALAGKMLLFFVGFVPTIVLPKAARKALAGESSVGIFVQAVAVIGVISAGGLIVYGLFPEQIVTTLAGAAFAPAKAYVFAYGIAMVLLAALNAVVTYKIGIHRFDFVVPLAICAIGEIVGISLHHATLGDVVAVLIAGNGFALVTCAIGVNARFPTRLPVTTSDAVA